MLFLVVLFHLIFPPDTLSSAWYFWKPYQYKSEQGKLTGLDIELMKAVTARMGVEVDYTPKNWDDHLDFLSNGELDFATGAIITDEREKYAYISNDYRTETTVIYTKDGFPFEINNYQDLMSLLRDKKIRLGVIGGFRFQPAEFDRFLSDSTDQTTRISVQNDLDNFANLKHDRIDAFLVDRLVAATLVNEYEDFRFAKRLPAIINSSKIHVLFSKKSVSEETVKRFNKALAEIKENGVYNRIVETYRTPYLLNVTVNQSWFRFIDIMGTIAFAISGIIIARKEHYDVVGAFVLTSLPSIGGGVLRDLFIGRDPIGVLRDPIYMLLILSVVTLGMLFFTTMDKIGSRVNKETQFIKNNIFFWTNAIKLFDALGLAAFTIVAVVIAFEQEVQPILLWAPLLAMITGSGGGILRDIVRADSNNAFLKGTFYPEIAFIWGFIFTTLMILFRDQLDVDNMLWLVVFNILGALFTRILCLKYKIKSITL
jgi:polar amino acid transport system substrate-binding protein